MADYIKLSDNTYPHSESSIRAANPQTSYPKLFRADGYAVVFPAPAAAHDPITHFVREIAPALTTLGTWEQRWETVALDAATVAANQARAQEQLINGITSATQQRLDDFARTRNYDNILSACTYATDIDATFAAEGQYCVTLRGATWRKLYEILDAVNAGNRPAPTCYADIEPELPVPSWPDWV